MKYFGTDGIRGIYGEGITEDVAYRAGRALAYLFGGTGIVGRDTRVSGPGLEEALCAGLTDGGADAVTVGIATTPEVAYLARCAGAAFGVSLSASHNPPEYNGIKIFSGSGRKLSVSAEEALEYYMDNVPPRTAAGRARPILPLAKSTAAVWKRRLPTSARPRAEAAGWTDCAYCSTAERARPLRLPRRRSCGWARR